MRRDAANKLRLVFGMALAALFGAAWCIGGLQPAAAQFRAPMPMMRRPPVRFVPRPPIGRVPVGTGRVWGPHPRIGVISRPVVGAPIRPCAGRYYRYAHCSELGMAGAGPIAGGGREALARHRVGRSQGNNAGGAVPPAAERRFVPDEVIVSFAANTPPQAVRRLARRYDLRLLEAQNFTLIGTTLSRWRIGGRRSVRSVLAVLQNQGIVRSAQPNYLFALEEDARRVAAAGNGDPAQYVLAKLQVEQAQQIATGANVLVAVIDSQIDIKHPDLGGSVVKSFNALNGEDRPQLHGTEMAGAIASHGKLLGVAPRVRLLAARAFDAHSNGTSFAIYRSLQWAADNGARIVNMSFAGPADPMLHRILAAVAAKDIVLVAAAGNAGPQAAPLYPAADPSVIAVTATDADDHLFKMGNWGAYIALAAPGVDILALAPGDAFQITTGTSVAAAHVSATAALLLQHDPSLKPADVRSILMSTAKPIAITGRHAGFDPGLVNAYKALTAPANSAGAEMAHEQAAQ